MVCPDFIPPHHSKFLTNQPSEKVLPKLSPRLEVPGVSNQRLLRSFSQTSHSKPGFTAICRITVSSFLLCFTKDYNSFVEVLLQNAVTPKH